MPFDRLKTIEALWSLWNLAWEQLVKWGVAALVVGMIATIGAFIYSTAEWIHGFGLAGWSLATFGALLSIVVMIGLVAWSVGQVRRLKSNNNRKPDTGADADRAKASAAEEARQLASLQSSVRNLERTAFLLATDASETHYRQQLEEGLKWFAAHPRSGPFETNEQLMDEVTRVQEFISLLQKNLAPSHWTGELHRTILKAEQEASYDEANLIVPAGLNPFQYRRFHIACLQYDRIGLFLVQSITEAKSQQSQMAQMIRDRPAVHK